MKKSVIFFVLVFISVFNYIKVQEMDFDADSRYIFTSLLISIQIPLYKSPPYYPSDEEKVVHPVKKEFTFQQDDDIIKNMELINSK